jgi:hypothetical protein
MLAMGASRAAELLRLWSVMKQAIVLSPRNELYALNMEEGPGSLKKWTAAENIRAAEIEQQSANRGGSET